MKPGTKILVAASSFECSTFEGQGTTEAELRACARQVDVQLAPTVTVDGESVPVAEVETRLLNIVLPAGNLFEQPAGTPGLSVGHGWVALVHPLTPGTHTIVMDFGESTINDDDPGQARPLIGRLETQRALDDRLTGRRRAEPHPPAVTAAGSKADLRLPCRLLRAVRHPGVVAG